MQDSYYTSWKQDLGQVFAWERRIKETQQNGGWKRGLHRTVIAAIYQYVRECTVLCFQY